MAQLKPAIQVIKQKELYYTVGRENHPVKFKPWLGDSFSFLYDLIMSRSVFPKKFGGDIQKHHEILVREMADIHGKQALELATGSGSAAHFLNSDNQYTGTDISPGLLKQAAKRFRKAGFPKPEFYVVSADDLPFERDSFDLCLCILALNFFKDARTVFQEIGRVLLPGGVLVCSVPVPEKNRLQRTIHGILHSEAELETICQASGFEFERISGENGALLYFKAIKQG